MTASSLRAHVTSDNRGQWLVLTNESDMDAAQMSGRWIKTTNPIEIKK
jgi:hypothetical protein